MILDDLETLLRTHPEAHSETPASGHLNDERIALVLQSDLSFDTDEIAHLSRCRACREVLAEVGRTFVATGPLTVGP